MSFELTMEEKERALREAQPTLVQKPLESIMSNRPLGLTPRPTMMDARKVGFSNDKPLGFTNKNNSDFRRNTNISSSKKNIAAPFVDDRRVVGSNQATVAPFKLETSKSGTTLYWKVLSNLSSVTDGLNGPLIDLVSLGIFDITNAITATKFIVLEASVDASFVCSGWTLLAVDSADAVEVGTIAGPPVTQNKIRLLIGKVTIAAGVATATQAIFSAQAIAYKFMNGIMVKGFEDTPVHRDLL